MTKEWIALPTGELLNLNNVTKILLVSAKKMLLIYHNSGYDSVAKGNTQAIVYATLPEAQAAFDLVKKSIIAGGNCIDLTPPDPIVITSITPNTGAAAGGTVCQVVGTGFIQMSSLSLNGVESPTMRFIDSTHIEITTPPNPAGAYDLDYDDLNGSSGSLIGGFTYV